MTKSLGSLLSRSEGRLAPLLRLHVHAATQQMAQGDLVPVLHRADKKKRDIVTKLLQVFCRGSLQVTVSVLATLPMPYAGGAFVFTGKVVVIL